MSSGGTRVLASLIAWCALSAVALVAGLLSLVAGIVAWGALRTGQWPGELQRHAWQLLATTVLVQALLPLWAATLATWLLLLRVAPWLDATWRRLASGIAALAALWFAPVGAYSFDAWTPTSARDVAATVLLCAGGVSAALLLPRFGFRPLAPGAFAAPRDAAREGAK
jgi:hypothetical protein